MKTTNFIKSLFFISLLIIGINFVLSPVIISASEKNVSTKNIDSGDEKFDRIFREGRELFDKEEWSKAAAKFNEIVCDCPEKTYVDAAFYWLAYCYKKQKMYKEANETVDRLLKNFPESSWAEDAQVLKIQLRSGSVVRTTSSGQGISRSNPPSVYAPSQSTLLNEAFAGTYTLSTQTKLDREDEIKLAAFQSLFAADPKKGIEAMGNLLRTDSKASETLKSEVLRTLRGPRLFSRHNFGVFSAYEITPTIVVTQINPILRETLVKSFQNESNVKIRTEIIYSIANINDDQSFNYLAQLYPAEANKDLKKAIINSFGSSTYTFTPIAETSVINKAQVEQAVTTASQNVNPIRKLRFDKLMEIFRIEKDLELRRLAFSNVQRFAGWSSKDGITEMLAQMYDAETDEQLKISIIRSFSGLKNNQTTNKLLDIAKNDKSDKLRLEAIWSLRNSNDPAVIKFLEDLIK